VRQKASGNPAQPGELVGGGEALRCCGNERTERGLRSGSHSGRFKRGENRCPERVGVVLTGLVKEHSSAVRVEAEHLPGRVIGAVKTHIRRLDVPSRLLLRGEHKEVESFEAQDRQLHCRREYVACPSTRECPPFLTAGDDVPVCLVGQFHEMTRRALAAAVGGAALLTSAACGSSVKATAPECTVVAGPGPAPRVGICIRRGREVSLVMNQGRVGTCGSSDVPFVHQPQQALLITSGARANKVNLDLESPVPKNVRPDSDLRPVPGGWRLQPHPFFSYATLTVFWPPKPGVSDDIASYFFCFK
jgi:hypothetical protein